MDYCLIPHRESYPSRGEDVDLGLRRVERDFDDREDIFILADSPGAVGASLFEWHFEKSRLHFPPRLTHEPQSKTPGKAIGLLGYPFHLAPEGGKKPP